MFGKRSTPLLLSTVLLSVMSVCHAEDASLKVTGTVAASVCKVTYSPTVNIGVFAGGDFPTAGSTSALKAMNINLTRCYPGLTLVKLKFSGVNDPDNPALLAVSDDGSGAQLATGVAIELMDNTMKTIPFNSEEPLTYAINKGMTTLSFLLRYKSTRDEVTAGEAAALLYFDLFYQ
ncbi:TPA: fimbrial protein [Citrobacter sedlakii]|uniref:fimbrial protein n=1 Tax=Citrobacter TaxID=544 RepID=UPI0019004506|nr:fimbrial protein [Citrobacter sedlakii]EKX8507680.1 fimbrial protein [Citrobacter sedlakii]MBJ9888395.1 fimbrial protein [Citrobacter sedlakii]MCK8144411.1 fimbrial protein [Citrobacter sedlakii]HCA7081177.1 fimbrial protein [Citrobacter sedlakii]HCA7137533.1 fimbrial protein [Citrobacter sedlakii]